MRCEDPFCKRASTHNVTCVHSTQDHADASTDANGLFMPRHRDVLNREGRLQRKMPRLETSYVTERGACNVKHDLSRLHLLLAGLTGTPHFHASDLA